MKVLVYSKIPKSLSDFVLSHCIALLQFQLQFLPSQLQRKINQDVTQRHGSNVPCLCNPRIDVTRSARGAQWEHCSYRWYCVCSSCRGTRLIRMRKNNTQLSPFTDKWLFGRYFLSLFTDFSSTLWLSILDPSWVGLPIGIPYIVTGKATDTLIFISSIANMVRTLANISDQMGLS